MTAPVVTAKDVASVAVKVIVEIAEPPAKVPKEPDAVTHAGASLTVRSDDEVLTANPLLFSTRTVSSSTAPDYATWPNPNLEATSEKASAIAVI